MGTYKKSCECELNFLHFFFSYCRHGHFETDVIERDAYVSLLRCNFSVYRDSKEEEKRDSGFCKKVACNSMGNGFINNFLHPPLATVWVKV